MAGFGLGGVTVSAWGPRLPAVKAELGISTATIGLLLANGGRAELTTALRDACLLLAVPAIASVISLVALSTLARARHAI